MDTLLQDLRYALRGLLKAPGFTTVAVLVLALGIGANTAIFSVVDAAFFKPMPFPESNRLVQISAPHPQAFVWFNRQGIELWPQFQGNRAFKSMGFFVSGAVNFGEESGERLRAAAVTAAFFQVLGVRASVGRAFTALDIEQHAGQVAVISDRLWRFRFGSDPAIAGRSIVLEGRPFVVLGVMPPRADVPAATAVWIPTRTGVMRPDGGVTFPVVIGRLRDGVNSAEAREDVRRIVRERERASGSPVSSAFIDVRITPLRWAMLGDVRSILLLVVSAAALVLFVACVNAANLLLTRISSRQREFSVRLALGASDLDLARQVLCEGLLLSLAAGVLTLPITYWTLDVVRAFVPLNVYGASEMAIDGRTLAATVGLSLLTAAAFSLAPSLSIRSFRGMDLLKGSSVATVEPFWRRFRSTMVVGEIAVAVVLLVCAVTVIQTVAGLMAVDLGARGERALVVNVALPRTTYNSAERVRQFYQRMEATLRAVPGVDDVAATSGLPGDALESDGAELFVDGEPLPPGLEYLGRRVSATPGYFATLGIGMVAGRGFTAADNADVPPVVIISERFARNLKVRPADAVGRRAILNHRYVWIVGVVRDVRLGGPEGGFDPVAYVPFSQQPSFRGPLHVVVTAKSDPRRLIPAIRAAASNIDRSVPAYNVRAFDDIRLAYLAQRRFVMRMMLAFGGLASLLAALGLYGVVSYLVQLQTREIGIRMALGATASAVRFRVMANGVTHAAAGLVAGSILALGVSRILSARVPALGQLDPANLPLLAAGGIAVSLAAAWFPARRATRIDPITALRTE